MNEKRFDAIEYGHTIIYRENGVNMWRNKVHVRLNELYDENQKLKEANQDLQHKLLAILDFINEKETVTHQEMKDFWNKMVMNNE